MKTVKFKDLPEKVKAFYRREICLMSSWEYVSLDKLHTMSEWRDATDEERLSYAEWKYPKSVDYICLHVLPFANGSQRHVNDGNFKIDDGVIRSNEGCKCVYRNGKWAEIISEPEKEERGRIEKTIKEMAKESIASGAVLINKEEPTFKAGDEVDHKFVNTGWLSEKAIFTGGFNTKGNPIVEVNGDLHVVKEIRKPDPDKVYREIAKETMKTIYRCITDNGRKYIDSVDVESMLIEMGKKVEALKKGKEL